MMKADIDDYNENGRDGKNKELQKFSRTILLMFREGI